MTDLFGDPIAQIVAITPEMADRWIGKNERNRPVRQTTVDRYAADMTANRWRFTGEAIKFSRADRLLDGQHRLWAIKKSGITVSMLVITNLEDSTQDVMDTGVKRTGADMLNMQKIKNATTVASLARIIAVGLDSTVPVSSAQIKEMVEIDPSIITICADVLPTYNLHRVPPTVLAYCYWRLAQIDAEATERFFHAWSTLANLPEGSPILALNMRLSNGTNGRKGHTIRKEMVAAIFIAWNAWRKGESRSIIKIPRRADGTISFPEPYSGKSAA